MGLALDEAAAWRCVLALRPGTAGEVVVGSTASGGKGPAPEVGISVDASGAWSTSADVSEAACGVLDLFLPLRVRDRFVVGQLGQSLDGRIATESGHSHYVNGPEDRRRLHRLRALSQAVVVGAGTVASDDPRLTVREVAGDHPVRVVLDPRGRLDPAASVFSDGLASTLWCRSAESAASERRPLNTGVEVVPLATSDGRFEPDGVLDMLTARGLRRVLVEGGGITVSHFLAADALDRLHLSIAPLLLGSGRPSITLPVIETLDQGRRPRVRHLRLGRDVLFELDFREPPA